MVCHGKRIGDRADFDAYGRFSGTHARDARRNRLVMKHPETDARAGGCDDVDALFSALAHERRRLVLRALRGTEGNAADLDALVETVRDGAGPPGATADDDRREVRAALRHVHLPKLAASGFVEYDDETERVRGSAGTVERRLLSAAEAYAAEPSTR